MEAEQKVVPTEEQIVAQPETVSAETAQPEAEEVVSAPVATE